NAGGVPDNFKNYFVLEFDRPFKETYVYNSGDIVYVLEYEGDHAGAIVQFDTEKGEQVHVKVASSFISLEQAEQNLKEIGSRSFEEVRQSAGEIWDKELSCIQVEGGEVDQLTTFYSCLYRSMLFPRK